MKRSRREFLAKSTVASASLAFTSAGIGRVAAQPRPAQPAGTPAATGRVTIDRVNRADVDRFVSSLQGRAIMPGDSDYETARLVWNGKFQRHPGLIAICNGPDDVARTVDFARRHNVIMAVRAGQHSLAGKSTNDGGLILDLSRFRRIEIDRDRRLARVEAGCLLGEFDIAATAHGLATTAGTEPTTGVAGLTLGGGLGYLMGKHGLTIDNLRSVNMVLADGRAVTANAGSNEDLFWAARGAGANFGVATVFEYELHPIGPILAGEIKCAHENLRDFFRNFRDYCRTIPDDVGITASLAPVPDGRPLGCITVGYFGNDLAEGERVLAPLRNFRPVQSDTVRRVSYRYLQSLWRMPEGFMPRAVVRSSYLRDLTDEAIDVIVANSAAAPPGTGKFVMENVHGLATRIPVRDTAYAFRFHGYPFSLHADCTTAEQEAAAEQWATAFWRAMQPHLRTAVYSNYLADEGQERARAAYGENFQRLTELKRRYDPSNFFNSNQNIPPAAGN